MAAAAAATIAGTGFCHRRYRAPGGARWWVDRRWCQPHTAPAAPPLLLLLPPPPPLLQGAKQRKAVDRRASKGRRLRYHVHEKLVNFLTPVDLQPPQFASQLMSNLFGGGSGAGAGGAGAG